MKKILIIVGTRPNFIKVTQFKKEAKLRKGIEVYIAHTGQHYDKNMSGVFFEQFNLVPDFFLEVGNGSVTSQMAETMVKIEEVVNELNPEILLAVGDVNSTLAAALVANKMNVPLGHVESGLRSRDREMPEEINRLLTDEITDLFFVTEESGLVNLKNEGKDPSNIHFVGNTMIDTLVAFEPQIDKSEVRKELGIENEEYVLVTMHRPSNVDNEENLSKILELLEKVEESYRIVFPVHPRTRAKLEQYGMSARFKALENTIDLPPLDYFSFQKLIKHAKVVVTDSGGIQEETTFRKVPCLTIRDNTERPSTTEIGTNKLMKFEVDAIVGKILSKATKNGQVPELWDGKATGRILDVIGNKLNEKDL